MKDKKVKKSKYKNKKTEVDDLFFDSEMESRFYKHIRHMDGISYELQPRFLLQGSFTDNEGKRIRKVEYVADFLLTHSDGSKEVIDIKGFETADFKIKAKWFKKLYPEYKFTVLTELPKMHGGGKGIFISLDKLKEIRKEAAKNGEATKKDGKSRARKKAGG
jgi:hypothetical protein